MLEHTEIKTEIQTISKWGEIVQKISLEHGSQGNLLTM